MKNEEFFKSYAGTEYSYEGENGKVNYVKMSHFAQKMSEVIQLGFVMLDIQNQCVSGTSDGAPDVRGQFDGMHGQIKTCLEEKGKQIVWI